VEEVIEALSIFACRHSAASYYRVRAQYNGKAKIPKATRAAMFIYLNKTCFNGLHRVNARGEFNVPAGRYQNPRVVDPEGLRAAHALLSAATLRCGSFEDMLPEILPEDFVYFDPPYEPASSTANFTSYTPDRFTRQDQWKLREVFRELDRRGCKLMLSN